MEGTNEGLAAAHTRGQRLGRPSAMTPEQIRRARDLLTRPDNTATRCVAVRGSCGGPAGRAWGANAVEGDIDRDDAAQQRGAYRAFLGVDLPGQPHPRRLLPLVGPQPLSVPMNSGA
ncbi:hypothetical protein ABT061_43230 [Streptosporangium sp. NPDC002544]|uniref:hypothetical protein n=1 Tax=Streptosporangium sp. NPDC002544 TaxID=3154538 RepID=UPI0033171587